MAEGEDPLVVDFDYNDDDDEEEQRLFAGEDRTKFSEDFFIATSFAYDLFRDVLSKYKLEQLVGSQDKRHAVEQALSPYCVHIGEAVIILSYVNRLRFKLLFEEKRDLLIESEYNCEKFLYQFCKQFYKEGHVEQFLIVCGFFIDFAIYLNFKLKKNLASSLPTLFGDIFRFTMRDTFYKKGGGWKEVKRKAKPWWHTYRNILHKQELDHAMAKPRIPNKRLVNFHDPCYELCNENFTTILKLFNYSTTMLTQRRYAYVGLDSEPSCTVGKLSPVCDLEDDSTEKTVYFEILQLPPDRK